MKLRRHTIFLTLESKLVQFKDFEPNESNAKQKKQRASFHAKFQSQYKSKIWITLCISYSFIIDVNDVFKDEN